MAHGRIPTYLQRISLLVVTFAIVTTSALSARALVISEVMFNPVTFGSDDGLEWVELYNNGSSAIVLDDYSLGWGGGNYTTGTLNLDNLPVPTLAPGAYIVIGGPTSPLDFNPDLQDGYITADGIGLFNVDAALIPSQTPIDALVYGTTVFGIAPTNTNNLVDATGNPATVVTAIAGAGSTAVRNTDGTWSTSATPTPGSGFAPVPEPSTALLLGLGLLLLARPCR